MAQIQKQKTTATKAEEAVVEQTKPIETPEVTDLLDEIDSVLEENAQEFVNHYIQQGGQ